MSPTVGAAMMDLVTWPLGGDAIGARSTIKVCVA